MEKIIKNYIKLFFGLLAAILIVVSGMLVVEYRFFKQQAEKMIELKEEYRNYLFAVRKIVDEYNKIKEQEEILQDSEKSEKKKESSELKDTFVVVNREPTYLRQSMIDFAKKQGQEGILKRIHKDELRDYNEQLVEKTQRGAAPKKKYQKKSPSARPDISTAMMKKRLGKPDIQLFWPIERSKFWLSSFFGPRKKPNGTWGFHHGIDMASMKGTPVKAAYAGVVVEAGHGKGFGKTILISHNHKYKTRYAHLSKIQVKVGQRVAQGDVIGKVGDTGIVRSKSGRDASHLHFEVYAFGKRVNPMYFLL